MIWSRYNYLCNSGNHLDNCEHFKCLLDSFKCPTFYCVKLRYVCDGFWDCPGGVEENNCNKTSSPNRYKCRNSSIFVSLESICDKIKDCPDVDDESSCDLKNIECPGRCHCLLYAAACDGMSGFPWPLTLSLPYQFDTNWVGQ